MNARLFSSPKLDRGAARQRPFTPAAGRSAPRPAWVRRRPRQELKSAAELAAMRRAGRIVHTALEAGKHACAPGVTTAEVDAAVARVIRAGGGAALFLNYPDGRPGMGFPGSACVSVNEEIVHGIPGQRRLKDGDLVTIDCGVKLDGWCADAAVSVTVGRVAAAVSALRDATHEVLETAIGLMRPGLWWSEVARAMQHAAERSGFGVVREYVGHGIGRSLHEQPQAPGFVTEAFERWHDFLLSPGMTLAIEPMLTLGSPATVTRVDGWTVVTADGMPACHVEHTMAVTPDGSEVLTDGR